MHLLEIPPEIILHICKYSSLYCLLIFTVTTTVSYLDLPDLAVLSQVMPTLIPLTSDPVLHKYRLSIVSPSRINHFLFGTTPQGHALRPTVGDLVQRGVIRGLGIERRWRMGSYFYSLNVSSLCLFCIDRFFLTRPLVHYPIREQPIVVSSTCQSRPLYPDEAPVANP